MRAARLESVAAPKGLIGGPFGSSLVGRDYADEGIPVIRGTNLSCGRFISGDFAFVPVEKYQRDLTRNTAVPGDVIYTQRGTLGQVAIVPVEDHAAYVVSQSQMRLRVDPAIADPMYVYYASTSSGFLRQIQDRAISTGVPHINLGILADLTIPLPPLAEQRAIAMVLGALDDKIEVNRKLAATADDLVRAEFDSILTSATQRVAVSELVRNARDTVQPSAEEQEYVGLEHLPRRHMWLDCVPEPTEISSVKSRFVRGDILFGKLRPNFHKVVSAPVSGICSTEILVLRAVEADFAGYVLAACSSDLVLREVTRATEGTRMPRTNWKQLSAVKIPWPGAGEARRVSTRILCIRDSIEAQLRENEHLSALRDTLLPKLMSGELRVEEAMEVAAL